MNLNNRNVEIFSPAVDSIQNVLGKASALPVGKAEALLERSVERSKYPERYLGQNINPSVTTNHKKLSLSSLVIYTSTLI